MNLRDRIACAINSESAENGSNTPDFVLAEYLTECLAAFDKAVNARDRWYGLKMRPGASDFHVTALESENADLRALLAQPKETT